MSARFSCRHCRILPSATSDKARIRLLECLVEDHGDPLVVMDRTLQVVAANSHARRRLDPESCRFPVPAEAFFREAALERLVALFSLPAKTSTAYFRTDMTLDGTPTEVCVKAHRLTDHAGKTLGICAALREPLSESIGEKACHPGRIEALGLYAAGIVHEFNNVIAVIAGRASLGLMTDAGGAKDRALRNVLKAARRAEHVVKDLLVYVEKRRPQFVPADLRTPLREALSLLGMELASAYIEFISKLDKLPPAVCDPVQISQVCFNLVRNAREALPEGGKITVTLKRRRQWAVITVCDNGTGISRAMLPHIFEPFVSHGPSGLAKPSGSGLGLFVAKEIVMAHGGDISVESTPAKGSKFTVRIPFVPDHPVARAIARAPVPPAECSSP